MIVKNEEVHLDRCLESVHDLVDEIIIVDTGSTDNTKEIAAKYNSQVYDFEWIKDFSAARNFSFEKATQEFIMWLDADDYIKPEDRKKLKQLKKHLSKRADAVLCDYNYTQDAEGNAQMTLKRNRLIRRASNPVWKGAIHENVFFDGGDVIQSDFTVTHGKQQGNSVQRNYEILKDLLDTDKRSDRDLALYAHECFRLGKLKECIKYNKKYLEKGIIDTEEFIRSSNELGHAYLAQNDKEAALKCFLRTFEAAPPRPEACCMLGRYFGEKSQFETAIFWYDLALQTKDVVEGGLRNKDYYGFLPELSLGSYYFVTGNYEKAWEHNENAGKYKPKDKYYLENKRIFQKRLESLV